MPREVPRIDFRSSAWRRPHRFTNSLISCEPADTVESPCGPAHTKQGCLSIRVACAYPNAHGRASSTRAPFGPSRRSSPHAIRACTPFESARHARDVQNVWFCMARHAKKKPLCLPFLVCTVCSACLACPACFACLTLHGYLACLACPARSACPACFACPAIPACLACGAFPALPACPA